MSFDVSSPGFRLLMPFLLTWTLAGCGGGGSGEPANPREEDWPVIDPAPTPPDDPATPLNYTGSDSRAAISSTNAAELFHIALNHHLTRIAATSVETSHSEVRSHASSEPSVYRRVQCAGGNVELTSELNQLHHGYIVLEYDECTVGDATFSGRVTITIDAPSGLNISSSSIAFDRLSIAGSDGEFIYSGLIEYDSRFSFSMEAIVENTASGKQYRFSGYREDTLYDLGLAAPTYSKTVSGRIYDSEYGYFDVLSDSSVDGYIDSSEILESRLILLGLNGSLLTGTSWARGGGLIELDVDDDSAPEHSAFVSIDGLLASENRDITDSDGDGLHDSWEQVNGYDPGVDDNHSGDTDGDGIRDIDELRLGTSPTDSESFPEVVDLSVALSDYADPAAIENPYKYIIEVTNHGTVSTETASASLTLPQGVTVSDHDLYRCSTDGEVVTCSFYILEPGSTRSYEIEVIAPAVVSLLDASVSVTSDAPEPSRRNNTDTETTQLQPPVADVAVSLSRSFIRMRAGAFPSGMYFGDVDIHLDSLGPDAALDTQISFSIPPELTLEIVEVSGGECTGGPDYVCTIRDEPSDNRFTDFGKISLDFESDTAGIYPMPITLSHEGTDPDPSNNSVTVSSFVGQPLPGSVWDGIDVAAPGDTVHVPPGYYYLSDRFEYDADINLASSAGPESTFVSIDGEGMFPGTGGQITGLTFTHGDGAIMLYDTDLTLSGNVFRDNDNPSHGFASKELIYISGTSNVTLEYSRFVGNACVRNSEVLDLVYIDSAATFVAKNNLFAGNACDGIVVRGASPVAAEIVNNTWADNRTALQFPHVAMGDGTTIYNNLFYGHTTAIDTLTDCSADCGVFGSNLLYNNEFDYAGAQDQTGVNGNISGDPLFTDSAGGDYALQAGSPAIDAAESTHAPAADLAGDLRPVDGDGSGSAEPDIGAYERQ